MIPGFWAWASDELPSGVVQTPWYDAEGNVNRNSVGYAEIEPTPDDGGDHYVTFYWYTPLFTWATSIVLVRQDDANGTIPWGGHNYTLVDAWPLSQQPTTTYTPATTVTYLLDDPMYYGGYYNQPCYGGKINMALHAGVLPRRHLLLRHGKRRRPSDTGLLGLLDRDPPPELAGRRAWLCHPHAHRQRLRRPVDHRARPLRHLHHNLDLHGARRKLHPHTGLKRQRLRDAAGRLQHSQRRHLHRHGRLGSAEHNTHWEVHAGRAVLQRVTGEQGYITVAPTVNNVYSTPRVGIDPGSNDSDSAGQICYTLSYPVNSCSIQVGGNKLTGPTTSGGDSVAWNGTDSTGNYVDGGTYPSPSQQLRRPGQIC